ncbi:uncharacterized protein C8Q71DRAFT_195295 [Rhodofomes roseus]|uniref:Uncharacterized protein n=1 Tax=Rhodofomes roseus TaxID=34475 RepID=A0ABQ8K7X6_9APHY|nr:uncharacterized protein C8Q71DRAFT_195295 [Rhodofomes roseus]KAH9833244.1 hypothetical protein C8Q71DRAFT_195295 [Rhodofomes roseus]
MDTLLSATSLPRCYVVLVLGAPTYKELSPILLSGHYAHSLVIVVTHEPPDIPNLVIPALRILHLSKPLSTENGDTSRLVNVLLWAEHVACDWREYGGSGIYQLPESDEDDTLPSGRRSGLNALRVGRHSARRHSMPVGAPMATSVDAKRPFDVLVNFLPNQLPDNVLLRHTIYITTISRPFFKLNTTTPSSTRGFFGKAKSIFGGSTNANREKRSCRDMPRTHVEALLTPRATTMRPLISAASPQIIHLLPPEAAQYPEASAKLVDSMEAFIASFTSAMSLEADAKKAAGAVESVQSYIMHTVTFGKALDCALVPLTPKEEVTKKDDSWGCEWTVADVLISGGLDSAPTLSNGATSPGGNTTAWISGPEDIALVPSGRATAAASLTPVAREVATRALLYKTPHAVPPAPIQISVETAARTEQKVVETTERRPASPSSTYSTSYGHEIGISPPPSFHEYADSAHLLGDHVAHVETEVGHGDGDHTSNEPPEIEEVPKSPGMPPVTQELQELTEIVLPRRVSLKRVESLLAGLKDVGAWRSRRASVDLA